MPATPKSDAPALRDDFDARLRLEVYDALAAANGVTTVVAQAELHGIHRATLFRIRAGDRAPSLELAMKMAADFNTTVEALFVLTPRTHPPSGPSTPTPPPGPKQEAAA